MLSMIRFILALALIAFVGVADAAKDVAQPTDSPKALLQDQQDPTDIYEIPFGTSVDEEKEDVREMDETIKEYKSKHAAQDTKK